MSKSPNDVAVGTLRLWSGSTLIDELHESEVLRNNPLGDPHRRHLLVYLPPGYAETDACYPAVLNVLAMTSCYSPDPEGRMGIGVPIDEQTGVLRPEIWGRWLACDPLGLVESQAENLPRLRLLFLDCGTRDEFHLHVGAREMSRRLRKLGIDHIHEEFDDSHMQITYSYDASLRRMSEAFEVPEAQGTHSVWRSAGSVQCTGSAQSAACLLLLTPPSRRPDKPLWPSTASRRRARRRRASPAPEGALHSSGRPPPDGALPASVPAVSDWRNLGHMHQTAAPSPPAHQSRPVGRTTVSRSVVVGR